MRRIHPAIIQPRTVTSTPPELRIEAPSPVYHAPSPSRRSPSGADFTVDFTVDRTVDHWGVLDD